MRRPAPALLLVFVLAACSGTTSDTTEVTSAATAATVAPATTATTTTTSTTTTSTTTTTAAPTTTAVLAEFDTRPGTPPHVFDSYVATLQTTMAFGDLEIQVSADGVWTSAAYRCDLTTGMGALTSPQSFIATPETSWTDIGSGYNETQLRGAPPELSSSCPSSPEFWENFVQADFDASIGEPGDLSGRPAARIDIADLPDDFDEMAALAGFEGAEVDRLIIWIDMETEVFLAMTAEMKLSAELMEEAGDIGEVSIVMDFSISQVNDPALVVDLPS